MSEKCYDKLKEKYSSRPPFVFFFNPNIQLEEKIDYFEHYSAMYSFHIVRYYVGYTIKRDNGKWVSIDFKL